MVPFASIARARAPCLVALYQMRGAKWFACVPFLLAPLANPSVARGKAGGPETAPLLRPLKFRLERLAPGYYSFALGETLRAEGGCFGDRYVGEAALGRTFSVSGWLELQNGVLGFAHLARLRFATIALGKGTSIAFVVRGGVELVASAIESRSYVEPASSGATFEFPLRQALPGARIRVSFTGGPDFLLHAAGGSPGGAASTTAGLMF